MCSLSSVLPPSFHCTCDREAQCAALRLDAWLAQRAGPTQWAEADGLLRAALRVAAELPRGGGAPAAGDAEAMELERAESAREHVRGRRLQRSHALGARQLLRHVVGGLSADSRAISRHATVAAPPGGGAGDRALSRSVSALAEALAGLRTHSVAGPAAARAPGEDGRPLVLRRGRSALPRSAPVAAAAAAAGPESEPGAAPLDSNVVSTARELLAMWYERALAPAMPPPPPPPKRARAGVLAAGGAAAAEPEAVRAPAGAGGASSAAAVVALVELVQELLAAAAQRPQRCSPAAACSVAASVAAHLCRCGDALLWCHVHEVFCAALWLALRMRLHARALELARTWGHVRDACPAVWAEACAAAAGNAELQRLAVSCHALAVEAKGDSGALLLAAVDGALAAVPPPRSGCRTHSAV